VDDRSPIKEVLAGRCDNWLDHGSHGGVQISRWLMQMRRVIQFVTIVAVASGAICLGGKPEDDAQKVAEQWLALVDAGKFIESWKATAPYFQRAVPEEQWALKGKQIRDSFGILVSRKLKSAHYTKSVPGAPDGEYVIIQFDTSFARKKAAVETITPMKDTDGRWKVSGYFIK
jgi:hypothetical protein